VQCVDTSRMTSSIREFQPVPATLSGGQRVALLPTRALAHPALAQASQRQNPAQLGIAGLQGLLAALGNRHAPARLRAQSFGYRHATQGYLVALELCHWQIELGGARWMAHGEQLALNADEQREIVSALATLFAEADAKLLVHANGALSLICHESTPKVEAIFPDQALGSELKSLLPTPLVWQRYLNEAQMLLAQLPLNQARAERGLPVVNSVWFWGANVTPSHAPTLALRYLGNDPILQALASETASALDWVTLEDWRTFAPEFLQDRINQLPDNCLLWLMNGQTLRPKPAQSTLQKLTRRVARWFGAKS
jgi:hypothetical protein